MNVIPSDQRKERVREAVHREGEVSPRRADARAVTEHYDRLRDCFEPTHKQ